MPFTPRSPPHYQPQRTRYAYSLLYPFVIHLDKVPVAGDSSSAAFCSAPMFPLVTSDIKLLNQWVHPCYKGQPVSLKTDNTGRIGWLCLTSGEEVCKTEDLNMILENLSSYGCPNTLFAPAGTIAVFLAAAHFEIPQSESTKKEVLIPKLSDNQQGHSSADPATSRVSVLRWRSETKVFTSGVFIQLAPLEAKDSLTDPVHDKAIREWLCWAHKDNEYMNKADDSVCFDISMPSDTREAVLELLKETVTVDTIVYHRICPSSLVLHFAHFTRDGRIAIRNYVPYATGNSAECNCDTCRLQIQHKVRKLGVMNSFVGGDHKDLHCASKSTQSQLSPPDLPPSAPFSRAQVICQMDHNDKGYFLVMTPDFRITVFGYNYLEKDWRDYIPLYHFNEMVKSVRFRRIRLDFCDLAVTTLCEEDENHTYVRQYFGTSEEGKALCLFGATMGGTDSDPQKSNEMDDEELLVHHETVTAETCAHELSFRSELKKNDSENCGEKERLVTDSPSPQDDFATLPDSSKLNEGTTDKLQDGLDALTNLLGGMRKKLRYLESLL